MSARNFVCGRFLQEIFEDNASLLSLWFSLLVIGFRLRLVLIVSVLMEPEWGVCVCLCRFKVNCFQHLKRKKTGRIRESVVFFKFLLL